MFWSGVGYMVNDVNKDKSAHSNVLELGHFCILLIIGHYQNLVIAV
jgi:predicted lactoylglutathione lyase